MGGSLGGGTVLSLSSGSTLIEHASGERVCDHADGAVTRQQARHGCPAVGGRPWVSVCREGGGGGRKEAEAEAESVTWTGVAFKYPGPRWQIQHITTLVARGLALFWIQAKSRSAHAPNEPS